MDQSCDQSQVSNAYNMRAEQCFSDNTEDDESRHRRRRHRDQNQKRTHTKSPKIIKNDCDDALYVKVEDLPECVRDQVRHLACDESAGATPGDGSSTARLSKNASAFPFYQPRRLSAQPTVEEIQMCFAQIDLAILMDAKPNPLAPVHLQPNAPANLTALHARLMRTKMGQGQGHNHVHGQDQVQGHFHEDQRSTSWSRSSSRSFS